MSDDGGASGLGTLPLTEGGIELIVEEETLLVETKRGGGSYSQHANGLGSALARTRTHVAPVSFTRTSMLPVGPKKAATEAGGDHTLQ